MYKGLVLLVWARWQGACATAKYHLLLQTIPAGMPFQLLQRDALDSTLC